MQEVELSPHAAILSQSLRDLGYSIETAIADIIDNSITAEAKRIDILFDIDTELPYITIIDDGIGMLEDELLTAMRLGSKNPREERDCNSLGRFGLGLKTASFSQCKTLTVVSKKNGECSSVQWDLDLLCAKDKWLARILTKEEINLLPEITRLNNTGTYVLWQNMDRIFEGDTKSIKVNEVYNKMKIVERHLSLVFHRYLSGEFNKITISINENKIYSFDPFCESNKATQILPKEVVRINGNEITIQPYILPHQTKFTKRDFELYQIYSDFLNNQGCYVYRNGRLMVWGDWFRLNVKSESTKLARIKIDFPSALDECWVIDIKKSKAIPPFPVYEKLKQIIKQVNDKSLRVHVGKLNNKHDKNEYPFWNIVIIRDKTLYKINREHPIIASFFNKLNSIELEFFKNILYLIERTIPNEAILSSELIENTFDVNDGIMRDKINNFYELINTSSLYNKDIFFRILSGIEPFNNDLDKLWTIIEDLYDNK